MPRKPKNKVSTGLTSIVVRPLIERLLEIEAACSLTQKYKGLIPIDKLLAMWYTWCTDFGDMCAKHSASVPASIMQRAVLTDVASVLQSIAEVRSEIPEWCRSFNVSFQRPTSGQVHVEQ